MPWTNAIGVTPDSILDVICYLEDDDHPHHLEYRVTPLESIGTKSINTFLLDSKKGFLRNSQKASGRPPKNLASWYVVRMPDHTWLSEEERGKYTQAICDEVACGFQLIGILNSHQNRLTGAEDINLLSATFTDRGHLVRNRDSNPIQSLRRRMDEVTLELNVLRKRQGKRLIQTMREVQRANAKSREQADIYEMLACLPRPPKKMTELKAALLSLECEITRWNPERDSVSFKLKGKKLAKKLGIIQMLEGVQKALKRLIGEKKEQSDDIT